MACFHPLAAWQLEPRGVSFSRDYPRRAVARLALPCGQCVGCRLDRSVQWAVRCVHEAQMHECSSFVTLTYSPEKLVSHSLVYREFQLFMKRLRRWSNVRVRFYMCGEYGGEYGRPHFHALLFGIHFPDLVHFRTLASGCRLYTSEVLAGLWPQGFSSVGDVIFESAAYVARYATKSVVTGEFTKRQALDKFAVDPETGECWFMVPEFNRMSLKPGIGGPWFERYSSDVFPHDRVVISGQKIKPPKYYKALLARADWFAAAMIDVKRLIENRERGEADNTPVRLAVREAVAKGRLSLKKRGFT